MVVLIHDAALDSSVLSQLVLPDDMKGAKLPGPFEASAPAKGVAGHSLRYPRASWDGTFDTKTGKRL